MAPLPCPLCDFLIDPSGLSQRNVAESKTPRAPLRFDLDVLGIETKLPRGRPCLRSQKNPNALTHAR